MRFGSQCHLVQIQFGIRQAQRNTADISGTLGNQNIAGAQHIGQKPRQLLLVFDKQRVDIATLADRAGKGAAFSAGNHGFAGAVDVKQQQRIDLGQHTYEIFVQVASAGIAVRLIQHHQPPLGPAGAHRLNHHVYLARMVAVVVHQQ